MLCPRRAAVEGSVTQVNRNLPLAYAGFWATRAFRLKLMRFTPWANFCRHYRAQDENGTPLFRSHFTACGNPARRDRATCAGVARGEEGQEKDCLFLTNKATILLKTKDRENEQSQTKPNSQEMFDGFNSICQPGHCRHDYRLTGNLRGESAALWKLCCEANTY